MRDKKEGGLKTQKRKRGVALTKLPAAASTARQAGQSRGHTPFVPQPKAGQRARCLPYVLARGSVPNRTGFGPEAHVCLVPAPLLLSAVIPGRALVRLTQGLVR